MVEERPRRRQSTFNSTPSVSQELSISLESTLERKEITYSPSTYEWETCLPGQLCATCQQITVDRLFAEGEHQHHESYHDLQISSSQGCPLCTLIRHAIIEYYIARFKLSNLNLLDKEGKNEADKQIAAKAPSSRIFMHAESWEDPWLLVRCSSFLGRLHLFGTGIPKVFS
jgi:hypothetical protein